MDELVQIGINQEPSNATSGTATENVCERFFWVTQDANYNVIGVFSAYGDLIERYEYTPYGQRTIFTRGWIMADFTGDGVVNGGDYAFWADESGTNPTSRADVVGDGVVNGGDYTVYVDHYGESLPANDTLAMYPVLESFRSPVSGGGGIGLCDIGHQGLMHDKEFGLVYNRARYFHPTLARFTGRDPLEYADGMSMYEYVRSNPLAYADPSGRIYIARWGKVHEYSNTGHDAGTNVHLDTYYNLGGGKIHTGGFSLGRKTWHEGEWHVRAHESLGGGLVRMADAKRWASRVNEDHSQRAYHDFVNVFNVEKVRIWAEARYSYMLKQKYVERKAKFMFDQSYKRIMRNTPVAAKVSGFSALSQELLRPILDDYEHVPGPSPAHGLGLGRFTVPWFGKPYFRWPGNAGPSTWMAPFTEAIRAVDYEKKWYYGKNSRKTQGLIASTEVALVAFMKLGAVELKLMTQGPRTPALIGKITEAWDDAWGNIGDTLRGKKIEGLSGGYSGGFSEGDLEDTKKKLGLAIPCSAIRDAYLETYKFKRWRNCLICPKELRPLITGPTPTDRDAGLQGEMWPNAWK